jgi:AmiR/NasT family two-component response regulator
VIIEQAKGVLVARSGTLSPEEAFAALRGYARAQQLRLSELAHDVVRGTVDVRSVVAHRARTQ